MDLLLPLCAGTQEEAARAYDLAAVELRGHAAITNFDISSYADYLQKLEAPKAQPRLLTLKPKPEPVDEAPLPLLPIKATTSRSWETPTPLLTPKPEPVDELAADPLPPGPLLLDADDVDHAIAEILPVLGMDPADFEARYPARRARALGWPSDDYQLRGLPLPDAGRFEDDIEALFEAAGSVGPGHGGVQDQPAAAAAVDVPDASGADAVSYAAATISSLASGSWW